jgi:hypothetical protein
MQPKLDDNSTHRIGLMVIRQTATLMKLDIRQVGLRQTLPLVFKKGQFWPGLIQVNHKDRLLKDFKVNRFLF